jgi:hypothetical protein
VTPEDRAWEVVRRAFEEHVPTPRRDRSRSVAALALIAAVAVAAAAASPPGRAVLDTIREKVGVENAAPALFSLPAPGRLLVVSAEGPWIVQADGAKRRLGDWHDASWSPFGRFVVASSTNELAALEPDGDVHWTLARPQIAVPRWGGSRADTRIAYLTRARLHVVAGDGTGDADRTGGAGAARVAPAWRPGATHVLAYVSSPGGVEFVDAAGSEWHSVPLGRPRILSWSPDGKRLLVVTDDRAVLLDGTGRVVAARRMSGTVAAAFAPVGHTIAVVRARDVLLLDADRFRRPPDRLFAGPGPFTGLAWAPDGRWLLVSWRAADQWVFLSTAGRRHIVAVSNVTRQFGGFPRLAGWCCANP